MYCELKALSQLGKILCDNFSLTIECISIGWRHYNLRCKRRFAIPRFKTERFKNSFLVRSCIDNEFQHSVSFVNEIDDVVYILTVLSFFIFIGCYYLFRTLSLSFYYTHYCKILLYYIIYYIVNTQFVFIRLTTLGAY